jgi:hypothetical protein
MLRAARGPSVLIYSTPTGPSATFGAMLHAAPRAPRGVALRRRASHFAQLLAGADEGSAMNSKALRRAARRERQAARLLGTERVRYRERFERAPDCVPVVLPCGLTLMPEVKTRERLPVLLTRALAQAAAYGPAGSIPIAVLSATGGEPVVVLSIHAFRIIASLEVDTDGAQLRLPLFSAA